MNYDITISNANFAANASPNDGFFAAPAAFETNPSTLATGLAKARAHQRYRHLILLLSDLGTNFYTETTVGGDHDTPHDSISFSIHARTIQTADEENPGETLTGVDAIKRVIARAMVVSQTKNIEYYDPTDVAIIQSGATKQIDRGIRLDPQEIGPIAASLTAAEAAITVTAT